MANPDDYHAKSKIAEIDQEMSAWAESKNIPGKYTGRTGARVLSADELGPSDPRYHAWARKVSPLCICSRDIIVIFSC